MGFKLGPARWSYRSVATGIATRFVFNLGSERTWSKRAVLTEFDKKTWDFQVHATEEDASNCSAGLEQKERKKGRIYDARGIRTQVSTTEEK